MKGFRAAPHPMSRLAHDLYVLIRNSGAQVQLRRLYGESPSYSGRAKTFVWRAQLYWGRPWQRGGRGLVMKGFRAAPHPVSRRPRHPCLWLMVSGFSEEATTRFSGPLPEREGHTLALTVLHVPYSLDSGPYTLNLDKGLPGRACEAPPPKPWTLDP